MSSSHVAVRAGAGAAASGFSRATRTLTGRAGAAFAGEIAEGWRLACQCAVEGDLEIELRQWDAAILVDETPFAFEPRPGLRVAVDLGTTTLVAQLLDLGKRKGAGRSARR